jgi:hypothetical protein
MEGAGAPMTLQEGYFISQILLTAIASVAAVGAWRQSRIYQFHELLKYVQDSEFRDARRTVITEISILDEQNIDWWAKRDADSLRLEKAAATVCGHYDLLAITLGFADHEQFIFPNPTRQFFVRHFAASIVGNHRVLTRYINYRRIRSRSTYNSFTRIRDAAVRYDTGKY